MDSQTPHGGQVFRLARRLNRPASQILDFSANINPLGPPSSMREALTSAFDTIRHYPDSTHHDTKAILARQVDCDPEAILIGNGAAELIDMVIRYQNPHRVIVLDPAFGEYRAAAKRNRVPVVSVPLHQESFETPWHDILSIAQPGDLVIWNNPHNPSGRCFSRHTVDASIKALTERGIFLMIDESFIDFVSDREDVSLLSLATSPGSLVTVVRSLTKYYAIPGLRCGYAVADPDWIRRVEALRDGWSVNQLAQVAAHVGLLDHEFAERTARWLSESQSQIETLWTASPQYIRYRSSVNFFLLRWIHEKTSRQLSASLEAEGILVRRADDFIGLGPGYWRLAIRTLDENVRLYRTVQALLPNLDDPP